MHFLQEIPAYRVATTYNMCSLERYPIYSRRDIVRFFSNTKEFDASLIGYYRLGSLTKGISFMQLSACKPSSKLKPMLVLVLMSQTSTPLVVLLLVTSEVLRNQVHICTATWRRVVVVADSEKELRYSMPPATHCRFLVSTSPSAQAIMEFNPPSHPPKLLYWKSGALCGLVVHCNPVSLNQNPLSPSGAYFNLT